MDIIYDNYAVESEYNYVAFSAEALMIVDHDEFIAKGRMPEQWRQILLAKIDFEKQDQYCVYIHELQHGFYNRLTDHKGIWLLTGMQKGIAEHSYLVERGKVYMGIAKIEQFILGDPLDNVYIFLPRGAELPVDAIMALWEKYQIGFELSPNKNFFKMLRNIMPKSYLIYYTEGCIHKLELYGHQVEKMFDLTDIIP